MGKPSLYDWTLQAGIKFQYLQGILSTLSKWRKSSLAHRPEVQRRHLHRAGVKRAAQVTFRSE